MFRIADFIGLLLLGSFRFSQLSRLQRPALRDVSHSGCAAVNTPLRQTVLPLSELHGRFRFSLLSRLQRPVPRVASALPRLAKNAIPDKASSACQDYTAASAFLFTIHKNKQPRSGKGFPKE